MPKVGQFQHITAISKSLSISTCLFAKALDGLLCCTLLLSGLLNGMPGAFPLCSEPFQLCPGCFPPLGQLF